LPALSAERITALLAQANDALLAADYGRGIRIYARLLEERELGERGEVRERLAIAHERNGQQALAKLEYEAYLAEFPTGAGAERVRQRLAGLAATAAAPRTPLRAPAAARVWDFAGGIAQYYRHDVVQPLDDRPDEREHAGVTSNADFIVRRHGERFALTSRVNAAYQYNLLDAAERTAPDDQLYVTNAYVDVADARHEWNARLGRQSVYGAGLLGRFDGAHVAYQWRPQVALNLSLGRPVAYPRHGVDRHRHFAGVSADLTQLVGRWDVSFFAIAQQIDGIADRHAAGGEARLRSDRWTIVGLLDADLSYAVVNSALVSASWRATDRLTLNARANVGAAPYLTTRNALIGQAAATIDELLATYSEAQIRAIARNRTAQASNAALGLSLPLFDRFSLNVDAGFYDFDATIPSAGVAALPDSGRQTFFYTSAVGSSILKAGDTTILSLRRSATRTATSATLLVDLRLPVTARLRLSPRLALTARSYAHDDSRQTVAAPALRIAYRWPRGHQFEAEIGTALETREYADVAGLALAAEEDGTERFISAGYWWQF
jgi:hypothetical protein